MAPDLVAVPAAAALDLAGCLVYSVRTLRGKVHPNGLTWLLWSVAPLIAFVAEFAHGVGISALMALSVGLGPLLVFSSAVARKGMLHRPSRAELACGIMSLFALAAWWRTRQPDAAVALSIAADVLATLPTLVKAHRDPLSEDAWPYFCVAVGSVLTLATLTRWSFVSAGFPGYLLLLCGTLAFLTRPRAAPRVTVPLWRSLNLRLIAGAAGILVMVGASAMVFTELSGGRQVEAGKPPKAATTLSAAIVRPSGRSRSADRPNGGHQTPSITLTRMGAALRPPKALRPRPGIGPTRSTRVVSAPRTDPRVSSTAAPTLPAPTPTPASASASPMPTSASPTPSPTPSPTASAESSAFP